MDMTIDQIKKEILSYTGTPDMFGATSAERLERSIESRNREIVKINSLLETELRPIN